MVTCNGASFFNRTNFIFIALSYFHLVIYVLFMNLMRLTTFLMPRSLPLISRNENKFQYTIFSFERYLFYIVSHIMRDEATMILAFDMIHNFSREQLRKMSVKFTLWVKCEREGKKSKHFSHLRLFFSVFLSSDRTPLKIMCSGVLHNRKKEHLWVWKFFMCGNERAATKSLKQSPQNLIRELLFIIIDAIESDVCAKESFHI